MKPILKYPGGKTKELKLIKPFFPKIKGRYMEPFVGGGSVFFDLNHKTSVVGDINQKLIGFYRSLKTEHEAVLEDLLLLQARYAENQMNFSKSGGENPNKKLYLEMRDLLNLKEDNPVSIHPAAIYYFINKTAYSGLIRTNKNGDYNVPFGNYTGFNVGSIITDEHIRLLKNTDIQCCDYYKIFNMATQDDFLFLDPPYDDGFTNYGNNKDFSDEEQARLACDFKNLSGRALMVIKSTPLIEGLYKGYIKHEYTKSYPISAKFQNTQTVKHLVITNY